MEAVRRGTSMYKGPVVEAQGDEERPVWLVWSKLWVV